MGRRVGCREPTQGYPAGTHEAPFVKRILYLAVACVTLAAASAQAERIQCVDGEYEGSILDQSDDQIFLEGKEGIVNIEKSQILSIDGKPFSYQQKEPVVPPAQSISAKSPSYLGYQPSTEAAYDSGVPLPNRGIQFTSIDDLNTSGPVASVPAAPTPDDVWIHPSGVTEKQLKDFYAAHEAEFMIPLKVRVKTLGEAFFTQSAESIRSKPEAEAGWRDGGWIQEGETIQPFSRTALARVLLLSPGQVSRLVKDEYGVGYLFWVTERQESRKMPYEEARPKVLNRILTGKR